MRKIKFRAWGSKNPETSNKKEMIHNPFYLGGGINDFFDERDIIFMQYTGLKDKNGEEIYEGDIYKSRLNTRFPYTLQVIRWDTLNQCWNPKISFPDGTMGKFHLGEVIGNIYENSDLLK